MTEPLAQARVPPPPTLSAISPESRSPDTSAPRPSKPGPSAYPDPLPRRCFHLQRHPPLPGNKIVLYMTDRRDLNLSARDADHILHYSRTRLLDRLRSLDDRTCIDIDDIPHPIKKRRITGNLHHRRHRITRRR